MNLAYYLIIAGVVLFAGVFVFQRFWRRAERAQAQRPPVPVNLASTTDAIFLSSGFGRITFANAHAREWFGLDSGDPDLELLAELASPPDVLRDLFAAEGRATFQVGYRRVDASSHPLPGESGRHMVVILRDMAESRTEYGPDTARALVALSRIGQQVSANTPLPDTLDFILDSLRQAIPYDAGQIVIQAQDTRQLQVLAQQGDFALLRLLTAGIDVARKGEGHTGWVITYGEPLLVEEGGQSGEDDPKAGSKAPTFESYLGVPLTSGEAFIGVLQVVKVEPHAFDYEDLTLLGAIADQTATAIDRARLYEDRIQRSNELAGVQAIARAAAEMTSRRDLFGALARQVAAALDVGQCGLLIYDPDGQRLIPERPFVGIPDAVLDALHYTLEEGSATQRVWQRDEGWYANDLRDEALIDEVGLRAYMEALGLRGLALMPMIVGRRRIGLVQVANLQNGEGFGPQELQRLRVFAAQAAVVVESVRLFDRDRDRQQEFEALQSFSLEAGRLPDSDALYSQASERLAGLLRAEMAGVLDYDQARQMLVAHPTFYGVDARVQEYIRIPVTPGSAFARLWQEESVWRCNDLASDPVAVEAGLSDLTSWVGITQVLLVPLLVRGQTVGALFASNKQGEQGFTRHDARLAAIFAAQLAVAHENSRLMAEVQAHVNEARGLRQISEIVGQHLPLNDLVARVLAQVTTFFGSTLAFVQFLDDTTGELKVLPEHVVGAALDATVITDAYGPDFEQSVVMTGKPLLNNTLAADAFRLPMYQPVIAALGLQQAIVAPLHAGGDKLGELVVANRTHGQFGPADLDRLTPIAAQLSAAVERLRLVQMTDATLWRRSGELSALERVSNVLAQTVEIERITQVIQQEALRVTGGEGCTVLMLLPSEEWADIEQPEVLQRYGDVPDAAEPAAAPFAIEQAAMQEGAPVWVEDYAAADLAPGPGGGGSAVAAPVMYDQRVVGVIHLYSSRTGAFDAGSETFVQALAGKAATAYLNAARFREQISRNQLLSRRVEQLNELYALGQALRAGQDIDDLLDAVAHAVHLTSGFAVVLVSIYDEQAGGFRRAAQAGIPLSTFIELRETILSREQVESTLQEEFRISQSYFLPAERQADWRGALSEGDFIYHDEYVTKDMSGHWHPDDALVVPLRDTHGDLLGIMSVDAPVDGRRPIRTTLEPLEVFAQQAAIGIENFRLVQAIQREVDAARRERDVLERL
ncbi:MAG: GAF domain-containing protein, partial [Anaerolineae bacterium]|nr:GAF domain-containing protein [Anaerolineae bacterium]